MKPLKNTAKLLTLLFLFAQVLIINTTVSLSQDTNYRVMLYFKNGNSEIVEDFSDDGEYYFEVERRGIKKTIYFKFIKTITFSDGELPFEITLINGKTEKFEEFDFKKLMGKTQYGSITIENIEEIEKIEFL